VEALGLQYRRFAQCQVLPTRVQPGQAWRTLAHWRDEILNYLDDPVTNAFAEGITNKIKVMKRRSYGFRDPVRYRHRVLLSCRRRASRHG
jgi:hypothetical protein